MLSLQHTCYLRPKVPFFKRAFWFGLMIAIRLWSYEPFKLRYTLRIRDKPFICENFFSFVPLGYAITLGPSFHFLHLLFVLQNLVITRYMAKQKRDIKGNLFLIGSRIFLSVDRLLKAKSIDKQVTHNQVGRDSNHGPKQTFVDWWQTINVLEAHHRQ